MKAIAISLVTLALLVPSITFAQTPNSKQISLILEISQLQAELQAILAAEASSTVATSTVATSTAATSTPSVGGTYTAYNKDGSVTQYVNGQPTEDFTDPSNSKMIGDCLYTNSNSGWVLQVCGG